VRLFARLIDASDEQKERLTKNIQEILAVDPLLRSKRELIEKFIKQNIPDIESSDDVENEFEKFWTTERVNAFEAMCVQEGIEADKLQQLIDDYQFSGRKPRNEELAGTLKEKPKILERDSVLIKINRKLTDFINTFIEGV